LSGSIIVGDYDEINSPFRENEVFRLNGYAGHVSSAIKKIDSGGFWGVFFNSLRLKICEEKYIDYVVRFGEYEDSASGLYVLEHVHEKEKNIACVVNVNIETSEIGRKAESLGAVCVMNSPEGFPEAVYRAFVSLL